MRHGEHQRHAAGSGDVDHRLGGQLHGGEAGIDVGDLGPIEPHPGRRPGPEGRSPAPRRDVLVVTEHLQLRPRIALEHACEGMRENGDIADAAIHRQAHRRHDAVGNIGKAAVDQAALRRDLRQRAGDARCQHGLEHGRRAQSAFRNQSRPSVAGARDHRGRLQRCRLHDDAGAQASRAARRSRRCRPGLSHGPRLRPGAQTSPRAPAPPSGSRRGGTHCGRQPRPASAPSPWQPGRKRCAGQRGRSPR